MGEVAVGDHLIDAHGKPTRVVAATDVMLDRPCYEVEFSDGTVIVADAEHHEVSAFSPVSRNMERTNIVADFRPLLDPYYGGASA